MRGVDEEDKSTEGSVEGKHGGEVCREREGEKHFRGQDREVCREIRGHSPSDECQPGA